MAKLISWDDSAKAKRQVDNTIIVLTWKYLGKVKDDQRQDGLRVVPYETKFSRLVFSLIEQGKDDDDIVVDINHAVASVYVGGDSDDTLSFSSIYTTAGNIPTFTGSDSRKDDEAVYLAKTPDVVDYPAFSVFSFDIDEEGKQAEDLVVQLFLERI